MKKQSITYAQVGDNYATKDPIKKLALSAAAKTAANLKKRGFEELSDSRGESAFVWSLGGVYTERSRSTRDKKQGDVLMASVIEGLGTKNLIADETRKITGKTYYDVIGHDTIAYIVNDLISCGAKPLVVHAYWAIEDNSWLHDQERMNDLINGWKDACDLAGAAWGGGETATMKQIVIPNTIDLAGSAVGIIGPQKRLIRDKNLQAGDRIVLVKSNGVNASGISLARAIAKKLPDGYATKLSGGTPYGEALLTKCNIYAKLVEDLLDSGIALHYVSYISGHGMRKLMRARGNFTYVIEKLFDPQEVFLFIQKHANINDYEMYQTYNMGQDYALFLPERDVTKAQEIIKRNGFESIDAGFVEEGPRQVVIKPKHITYKGETLDLR